MAKSSYMGTKMGSLAQHVVKSKGMPGVTASVTGTPNSRQSSSPIQKKFVTNRRHA